MVQYCQLYCIVMHGMYAYIYIYTLFIKQYVDIKFVISLFLNFTHTLDTLLSQQQFISQTFFCVNKYIFLQLIQFDLT